MLIPDKILQKGIKRFGTESVLTTLEAIQARCATDGSWKEESLTSSPFSEFVQTVSGRYRRETQLGQIARFLLQDRVENLTRIQTLVAEINGVSEPATVPHQSPRAGDTSRTGVNGS